MPYMQSRGDYLGGGYQRGDPGLFGFLGGIAKKIIGASPLGQAAGAVGRIITGTQPIIRQAGTLPPPGSIGGPAGFQAVPSRLPVKVPGVTGVIQRLAPGGETGYTCPVGTRGYHLAKDGSGRMVRNRTMNIANPKALRRAIRREQGFVKLAQRSLKGTGYKISRR